MKTRTCTVCITVCFFALVFFPKKARSQQPPPLSFTTYTLDSGTANTTGAVYRFANVTTGVDALVKISSISAGIQLKNIDRTADGYQEAFQPEYKINAEINAWIDFRITFVTTGTSIPSVRPLVAGTGLDIDGSSNDETSLKEYNMIDMGGGSYEYNTYNSQLILSQAGTAITGTNATGQLFGALVDTTAKEVMYTVTATNVTAMTFRVGSDNQNGSSSTRYASLYFKKFTYQHFPLAISGLLSFNGVAVNNRVNLSWELAPDKYSRVILEKSNTAANFSPVYEEMTGSHTQSGYTDADVQGNQLFYRLKAISISGKTEYSSIISVKLNGSTGEMKVCPSLIRTGTTVGIEMKEKMEAVLLVSDLSGRIVKQQKINLQAGSNNIALGGFENYTKGNYVVAVRTAGQLYTKKVVVQ
ncbi:MAG: T9SS type A sorting domain-containing protein [Sphingobacteriales bacterium]|nr:T9SS type A sorting domain-containing protein [Sphingobacteriales bacterium]